MRNVLDDHVTESSKKNSFLRVENRLSIGKVESMKIFSQGIEKLT